MMHLLRVVDAGLRDNASGAQRDWLLQRSAVALYMYTYSFWLVEFRRVVSWSYAAGVAWGISPREIARDTGLSWWRTSLLWPVFVLFAGMALAVPHTVFDMLRPSLYALAKRKG